jgi:hypothetical protein
MIALLNSDDKMRSKDFKQSSYYGLYSRWRGTMFGMRMRALLYEKLQMIGPQPATSSPARADTPVAHLA